MTTDRPARVISIDGGEARPVHGASMDAAIAGLEHASGRVEVAPANRVRTLTPNEARALDLQTNGFHQHAMRHGLVREVIGVTVPWGSLHWNGEDYPNFIESREQRVPRVRVSIADWDRRPEQLIDADFYVYVPINADMGMEPWLLGDGIDKYLPRAGMGDFYDVWLASGRCLTGRPADFPLYVTAAHFDALYSALRG